MAREQRTKLETIKAEVAELCRRIDRLWHAVETSDLETNDILPRLREHQERQDRLEATVDDARRSLSERRAILDSLEAITALAEKISEFLRTSELTESGAFIRSSMKEIAVKPGTATIRHTIPTPPESPIGGGNAAEVEPLPQFCGQVSSSRWRGPVTNVLPRRRDSCVIVAVMKRPLLR